MKEIIAEITKDCQRDDCRIYSSGMSSTLMNYALAYDRNGNQVSPDPNTTTEHFNCGTCGGGWSRKTKGYQIWTEMTAQRRVE